MPGMGGTRSEADEWRQGRREGVLGMAKNIRRIYLEVTQDEYELPLKVANSPEELAKMCGTTKNAVCSAISHYKAGRLKKTRFRSVPYYEEDLDG